MARSRISFTLLLSSSIAIAAPPEGISTVLPAKRIASSSDTSISSSRVSAPSSSSSSTYLPSAPSIAASSSTRHVLAPEAASLSPAPTRSREFLLPGYDQTLISLGYGASSLQKPGDELTAQDFDTSFVYAFHKEWSAGINVGYNSTRSSDVYSQKGLKDIGLSLNRVETYEKLTAVYGLDVGISPSDRIYPTATGSGNNFSGGYSAAPYWGFEKSLRSMTVGMKAQVYGVYFPIARLSDNNTSLFGYRFEGFDEFPLNRDIGVGVLVGLGHSPIGNYSAGNSGLLADTYAIKGYGFVSVNPSTSIQLSLGADSVNSSNSSDTTTTAGVALKTVL